MGSPVYADAPTSTTKLHIERIGDLEGVVTLLLVDSAGSDGGAEAALQQTVEEHNDSVETVVSLFTNAPNEGNGDPLDIAKQAGRDLFIE